MRLRYCYLLAGICWAVLLGPLSAYVLFAFAAGVSWIWLLGDDSWPDAAGVILPAIGIAGGLAVAITCVTLAFCYGKRRELSAGDKKERSMLWMLMAAPFGLFILGDIYAWLEMRQYTEAMQQATQREAAFVDWRNTLHDIEKLSVNQPDRGIFRIDMELKGSGQGSYQLHWKVTDKIYRATLAQKTRMIRLDPGPNRFTVPFTLQQLARSYQEKVLNGAGGVLVEEDFLLKVTLTPELTRMEQQILPPGEKSRLTSLRMRKEASFPVRFQIPYNKTATAENKESTIAETDKEPNCATWMPGTGSGPHVTAPSVAAECDNASFEELNYAYAKDWRHVYYKPMPNANNWTVRVMGADPATFRILRYCHGGVAIDKHHVYEHGKMVEGIAPEALQAAKQSAASCPHF